ncbi:MAG: OmpA family protein [Gammaproteobacteria bacterium]|nr:OmpA family protein [Gammaproteobacteria bacterium]
MLLFGALPAAYAGDACNRAADLIYQAHEDYNLGAAPARVIGLLQGALDLCPGHADAHNNLGFIYLKKREYSRAEEHYRQAVQINPGLSKAWSGLGEVYYQSGRFALSLEAHLHACHADKDSLWRAGRLLNDRSYQAAAAGQLPDKENLLVLYDSRRRQTVKNLITRCGFGPRVYFEPVLIIRNISFGSGRAALGDRARKDLAIIADTLKELQPSPAAVKVGGHTDDSLFQGLSRAQSERRNLTLSRRRAQAVAKELAAQGVPKAWIVVSGHGTDKPWDKGDNEAARARNRRVEIEVVY